MDESALLEAIERLKIDSLYLIEHDEASSEASWKKMLKKQDNLLEYQLTRIWVFEMVNSVSENCVLAFIIGLSDTKIDLVSLAGPLECTALRKASSELVFDILNVKKEEVSPLCITKENASKIRVVLDSRISLESRLLAFRLLSTCRTIFFTHSQLLDHFLHLGVWKTDLLLKQQQKVPPKSTLNFSKESKHDNILIGITVKKNDDFSEWYRQVLIKGDMVSFKRITFYFLNSYLIDYYDISGCYILKPASYYIWEQIQKWFDMQIKKLGVENCYFPMFVSSKALGKEKDHIEGFAPEVAWVTKAGNSNLEEPIAIRPTSETIMYPYFSKWIRSYRDLPLKLNQWNSVVRWEFKHPQPFLRTREFSWQEGHTAYLDKEESEKEVFNILHLYERIYVELLAVPVIKGIKSEKEKFAGAVFTSTIEGFIPATGRGIQAATSHSLGQNFSKMFDISVEDPNAKLDDEKAKLYVWQNSWGLSTRAIGIMVMTHSDDKGLVMPPRVSRTQIIVIPCGITAKTTTEQQKMIMDGISNIVNTLKKGGFRVKSDLRTTYSPGWKFSHWEMMGVPLRLEYGLMDHEALQVVAVRRDTSMKTKIPLSQLLSSVFDLLETIQSDLYKKAKKQYDENVQIVYQWEDFVPLLNKKKLLLIPWCKRSLCEEEIRKNSTSESSTGSEDENMLAMGAKSLCIPLEQPTGEHLLKEGVIHCTACGELAITFALFGRSY
ncbi:proline-tRNA ligase [Pneumocystis jirovecii RU7]|uniref:proline--tRNA ligase n=1 Tax=Pneumocystis jirovecii (strain RU7) TaxID=1408657 RepID=A0A0W4ZFJ1_PNEJ7|nr:proline-tRNA ligase [Pneumocystis jirovecii RU7]KTW27143.1 proline-tRNA ligase [Pneumocystis jirovecii RU7]